MIKFEQKLKINKKKEPHDKKRIKTSPDEKISEGQEKGIFSTLSKYFRK